MFNAHKIISAQVYDPKNKKKVKAEKSLETTHRLKPKRLMLWEPQIEGFACASLPSEHKGKGRHRMVTEAQESKNIKISTKSSTSPNELYSDSFIHIFVRYWNLCV